jgi:hypothetical protein
LVEVGAIEDLENVWWARLYRRVTGCRIRQRGRCTQGVSWFLPRQEQQKAYFWIIQHITGLRAALQRARNPF